MIAAQGANGMINNVQGPIQAAQQPPQNNALAVGNAQNPIVVSISLLVNHVFLGSTSWSKSGTANSRLSRLTQLIRITCPTSC